MPADRIAFHNLIAVYTTQCSRVTGVTRVNGSQISDLDCHGAGSARVTSVTEVSLGPGGHMKQSCGDRRSVTEKIQKEHADAACSYAATRSRPEVVGETDAGLSDTSAPAEWHALFEERAAIREFEGGFSRAEAERLALAETTAALGPKPEADT